MTIRVSLALAVAAASVAAPLSIPTAAQASTSKAHRYASCAALNATYRHGVGRSGAHDRVKGRTAPVRNFAVNTAVYNANKRLDRDHDGVACEKH